MKLLADENVDRAIVDHLRADNHDVAWVAEDGPGASDDAVLTRANDEDRLLVTADNDFGELVFRDGRLATGVVLVNSMDSLPMRRPMSWRRRLRRTRLTSLARSP